MKPWFAALVVVTILGQAVFNGGRVALSWRVLDFGGSAATVGWFTAAFSLVPLLIALPAGRLVDGRRAPEVMQAGLIATVAAAALMALSPGLELLLIGYVLLGFAHMTSLIAAQGMVSHLRSGARGLDSLFAYFTLGISVGQFVGILVAGALAAQPLAGRASATTPALWALAAIGLVALVVGWPVAIAYRRLLAAAQAQLMSHGAGSAERPGHGVAQPQLDEARAGVLATIRRPGMSAAMAVSISVIVAIDLMTAYVPVLGRELSLSVGAVTAILGARSGMAIVSRALMPTILKYTNRERVLLICTAAGVVPLAVMPWLLQWWLLAVASGVCGFVWGFVMPMSMTWVSTLSDVSVRAQALSVRLLGNRLAQVAIPPVAGLVATAAGAGSVFVIAAMLIAVATFMAMVALGDGGAATAQAAGR